MLQKKSRSHEAQNIFWMQNKSGFNVISRSKKTDFKSHFYVFLQLSKDCNTRCFHSNCHKRKGRKSFFFFSPPFPSSRWGKKSGGDIFWHREPRRAAGLRGEKVDSSVFLSLFSTIFCHPCAAKDQSGDGKKERKEWAGCSDRTRHHLLQRRGQTE